MMLKDQLFACQYPRKSSDASKEKSWLAEP
jgi:hypothetical protein